MTGKHLINSVEDSVQESLYGLSKLHPNYEINFSSKIVSYDRGCRKGKVAIVSGGGSGHEPFPAGYVGKGMMSASVSGSVFASPPSTAILRAIHTVAEESSGVLLVVANYTGDVLNFGLAAETATAEGVSVESVVVGEDVAQEALGTPSKAGRRGTCGLVLVLKIAGYLAEAGRDLETVKKFALEAVHSMGSMGLCVEACSKPGVGLLFGLGPEEMEVGVGVHGEAGVCRSRLLPARGAVRILVESLVRSLRLEEDDEVVAMVNNLGSLSCLEEWLLAGELEKQLAAKQVRLSRLYAGPYFTSLNMAGVQICLLKLNTNSRELFLDALDFPTTTPAWRNSAPLEPGHGPRTVTMASRTKKALAESFRLTAEEQNLLKRCFVRISEEFLAEEAHLNRLDSVCGDGDCGTTLARLGLLLREAAATFDLSTPGRLFFDLSLTTEESIGGTSGALYGLFLKSVSKELLKHVAFESSFVIPKCWRAGVEGIKKYSAARLGDRTMLDSLESGCAAFEKCLEKEGGPNVAEAFERAVDAAAEACQRTRFMRAAAGRASYTDPSRQSEADAGAYAVTVWLSAVLKETQARVPRSKQQ